MPEMKSVELEPYCKCCGYIVNERVTFSETCDTCHTPVDWHDTSDKKLIEQLKAFIADDAQAATFQSMGQYRSRLLGMLIKINKPQYREKRMLTDRELFLMREAMKAATHYGEDLERWLCEPVSEHGHIVEHHLNADADRIANKK